MVASLLALLWSSAALAESAQVPPAEEPQQPRWYGWKTLAIDAVPLTLFLAALPSSGEARVNLLGIGAVPYLLGGPIVHLAHGNVEYGTYGFGLRVALPAAGALIGSLTAVDCASPDHGVGKNDCDDSAPPILIGGVIGAALAVAVDDVFFAHERFRPQRGLAASRARWPLLAPSVAPTRGGVRLTLGGAF